MLIYKCALPPGAEPRPVEVAALAWVEASALAGYDVLAADVPLVRRLVRDGIPAWTPSSRVAGV